MIDLVYEQWNSVQNQASAIVFNSIPDIEISYSLPIPGMNHLASYYNVEMLISGRSLSLKESLFNMIDLLRFNYGTVDDFHRYLWAMIPNPISLDGNLDYSPFFVFKMNSLLGSGDWWEDLNQKIYHKRKLKQLNIAQLELYSMYDVYSSIFYTDDSFTPESIRSQTILMKI